MNIAELLRQRARERPETTAIIESRGGRDRTVTFAGLEEATARGAALLREKGLLAGDTVLVFQPLSIELYIILLSLFRRGITAMIVDPSAGREHLERCCSLVPPQGLIASPKAHLLRLVSPALRRIPLQFATGFVPGAVLWRLPADLPPERDICPCSHDTPALITFTSGSTGLPKGVARSHGFLLEQLRVLEKAVALVPRQIDLTTLPVFVLANLASGVTSVLPEADLRRPGSIDPAPVLRQIDRLRPTRTTASPALLERLCDGCTKRGRKIDGFATVFTGGGPVFPRSLKRFAEVFPGADIVAVYGSTEAEPVSTQKWREVTETDVTRMSTGGGLLAGTPVAEIRVRIIGAQWGKPLGPLGTKEFEWLCLPDGETGEIIVTGGHVLKGYLNQIGDEETKVRVDGEIWHRTGDSGYFDPLGRLWLMGRSSAVIDDDRGTLYPFAVECAALGQPAVRRAALVRHRGKRVIVVEPAGGVRTVPEADLLAALSWAGIDEVRVVRYIPLDKRHNAKVDYPALLRLLD